MKAKIACIVITVIAALLVSCQTTQKPFKPKKAPLGFTLDEEGTLVHIHSGGKFPMYINPFIRGNTHSYDRHGYDISVGYGLYESGAAEATIYIYPSEGIDLKEHFQSTKYAINYYNPSAHQLKEFDMAVEPDDGSKISGCCAVYTFEAKYHGRNQMVESQAFVFKKGKWFISFRITYPITEDLDTIRREVNLLVTEFDYSIII